jgi:hypothetical protein
VDSWGLWCRVVVEVVGVVGRIVLWFMTRFESRGDHGRGEQWNAREMRVYAGSGLVRIKTLCPICVGCIMIAWVETPSTSPFIG